MDNNKNALSYDDYNFILSGTAKGILSSEEIAKASGKDPKDPESIKEAKKFLEAREKGERALYNKYTKKPQTRGEKKQNEKNIEELKTLLSDYDFSLLVKKAEKLQQRDKKQEGGSILVPVEMQGVPQDTYSNIPEEDMQDVMDSQLPDDEMEDDFVEYVMGSALEENELDYLINALESDDQLSMIFDKVILASSEFSGAGEVEGPGDGTSDSIPARLSDGEFVFTKKATDQLGADNLQTMMDDAERAYDGGLMKMAEGGMVDEPPTDEEEIKNLMLQANRMPSLMNR